MLSGIKVFNFFVSDHLKVKNESLSENITPLRRSLFLVRGGITLQVILFISQTLQSVSWILAEFRHNKIVQLLRENCFNVCRQLQRNVRSRKRDV